MGLLDRLRGAGPSAQEGRGQASLARDAVSMRDALDALRREAGDGSARLGIRSALRDMLEGEIAAPTADVAALRDSDTDPSEFYAREIAPSWDGLNEAQRAARLDGFFEMCALLETAGDMAGLPEDMAVNVRTKTLLLAWAFDEEYGYLPRLARGEQVAV
jgi:hypothetical protein